MYNPTKIETMLEALNRKDVPLEDMDRVIGLIEDEKLDEAQEFLERLLDDHRKP